jgi:thymidine kinase
MNDMQELINANTTSSLNIVVGPMFSSKSSYILTKLTNLSDLGHTCLIIIPTLETRNNNSLHCHSSGYKYISSKIDITQNSTLMEINIDKYDAIGIDEAQFFSDLVEVIKIWMCKKKRLYVASLDGDFHQNLFGDITKLLPIADEFIKIKSKCVYCCNVAKKLGINIYNDAICTIRKGTDTSTILIGALDIYEPVCRYHLTY